MALQDFGVGQGGGPAVNGEDRFIQLAVGVRKRREADVVDAGEGVQLAERTR